MIVFYAEDHQLHWPKWQYFNDQFVADPEVPGRADAVLAACQQLNLQIDKITTKAPIASLAKVHSTAYIGYLRSKCASIRLGNELLEYKYASDTFAPLTHYTYDAACKSANLALVAAKTLLGGNDYAYAICRPPGHHAGYSASGGFCYFNNAAVAAAELSQHGKVAILDIDYHHGNGTQDIFYERSDIMYVSLHADPSFDFPHNSGFGDENGSGAGLGFNFNYPLSKNTSAKQYMDTLDHAICQIKAYGPRFVVLSLGFDAYKDDPIAGFDLDSADYKGVAGLLAAKLPYPTAIVQEGGYNASKLKYLARQFFSGYLG